MAGQTHAEHRVPVAGQRFPNQRISSGIAVKPCSSRQPAGPPTEEERLSAWDDPARPPCVTLLT